MFRPLSAAVLLVLAGPAAAQVSLTGLGTTYFQNLDGLASAPDAGLQGSSTLPAGWAFKESGAGATALYAIGDGSADAANTYSFGAAGGSDRALGSLRSGASTFDTTFGVRFVNNTGGAIPRLTVSYTGELWRRGVALTTDRLDFQYSLDATALDTGTWVDVDGLDFNSIQGLTAGPLDGNAAANRVTVSDSIGGLSIPAGGSFWVRWNDALTLGVTQDGLAVDNFSLTPVPEPAAVGLLAAAGLAVVRRVRRGERGW